MREKERMELFAKSTTNKMNECMNAKSRTEFVGWFK